MKVQFELMIGENKFTLTEDVESNADFFKKLSFYSTLPKVGPNGETDLILRHRVAQGKYDYFSIVSEKADQEFKFGQAKPTNGSGPGALFSKGWEPLFHGEGAADADENSAPAIGIGAPMAAPTPAPAPLAAATRPAPAATRAPAPAQAAAPAPAAQVANQAASVLAKFGIGK